MAAPRASTIFDKFKNIFLQDRASCDSCQKMTCSFNVHLFNVHSAGNWLHLDGHVHSHRDIWSYDDES